MNSPAESGNMRLVQEVSSRYQIFKREKETKQVDFVHFSKFIGFYHERLQKRPVSITMYKIKNIKNKSKKLKA